MLDSLIKFATPLFKSIFVCCVLFLVFFSIITGTFPPDFTLMRATFNNIQQLKDIRNGKGPSARRPDPRGNFAANDENDIRNLENFNRKRAEITGGLAGSGSVSVTAPSAVVGNPVDEVALLKTDVKRLQMQMVRMQQRVSDLEERGRRTRR